MSAARGGGPSAVRRAASPFVKPFVAALAAAFAVRVAAGLALNAGPAGPRGFDLYGDLADNLLAGRGLGWDFYTSLGWKFANRPPLYPLFLAAVRGVAGTPATVATIVAQAALGALGCLVPALFARRWAGERAARVALWVAALWPYSVLVDTGLVEHVLFTPLALLGAYAVLRADDTGSSRTSLLAGAVCALGSLARVTFVPTIGLFGGLLLLRRGLRPAAALAAGAAAVLLPWAVRNHSATGEFVLGSDGGRALWVGNSPGTFRHYPDRSIDDSERDMLLGLPPGELAALGALPEMAQDRRFREMARANVAADPGAVAWGALRKVGALWSPVYNPAPVPPEHVRHDRPPGPAPRSSARSVAAVRYGTHGVTFVLLVAAALAGIARVSRVRADLPALLALAASFSILAALFWGQPRYLAPLHGIGIALGAAAWCLRPGRGAADGAS